MCLPSVDKFLCYYELKTGVLIIGVVDLVSFHSFNFSQYIFVEITNIYICWDHQNIFVPFLQIYSLLRSIDSSLNLALGGKTNPFQTPFKGGVQNNTI